MNMHFFTPFALRKSRGGFTLIEILVVIAILGILMGITTQMLGGVSDSQGRARAKTDMELLAAGLEAFNGQYGGYPRLNSASGEKFVGGEIYKCLVGKMILKVQNEQVVMEEVSVTRKPFVDAGKLLICDPQDPYVKDVDAEKNGVYFGDPWLEPYLYFFDTSASISYEGTTWKSPGFVLMSKGPDKKERDSLSLHSTGIVPDEMDYTSAKENVDNIIQGRDT